jgi:hypothetical protein
MSTDDPIADISGEAASASELRRRSPGLWARQSGLRASAGASLARGINLILGLGTSIFLARSLGPEQRGNLAVVLSLLVFSIRTCLAALRDPKPSVSESAVHQVAAA